MFAIYAMFIVAILCAPLMVGDSGSTASPSICVRGMLGIGDGDILGLRRNPQPGSGPCSSRIGAYMLAMSLKLARTTSHDKQGSDPNRFGIICGYGEEPGARPSSDASHKASFSSWLPFQSQGFEFVMGTSR